MNLAGVCSLKGLPQAFTAMVLNSIEELSDDSPPRPTGGSSGAAAKASPKGAAKAKAKAKASSKKKAVGQQSEAEDGGASKKKSLVLKRPAAAPKGSPKKRPAKSERPLAANKYMYTTQSRYGIWGIKTANKEVVRAGLVRERKSILAGEAGAGSQP